MTNSLRTLSYDKRFMHTHIGVMQSMLWQTVHAEGGAEPSVILTYIGGGEGAPAYVAMAESAYNAAQRPGWAPVAHVGVDGVLTPVKA